MIGDLAAVPQLAMGSVTHARLRPRAHRFTHQTYFLLLPLRSLRVQGSSELARNRFGLVAFFDRDHGDGREDCLSWLDDRLAAEGIRDADGEVWLQTYPRVLGYVFKPVSFWYCHRRDGTLRAVLAEVNNTFGERHCYLLDHQGLAWDHELRARKVFHVSPFCRVGGDYRFRFACSAHRVVARITHHDGQGPLLLTSMSGTLAPATAARQRAAFVKVPLMTLMVMVRIHWHAIRLWLKRVPWFVKPDPPAIFITRSQAPSDRPSPTI
jgi:DUF1365 family protein